jgi:hypothetical protein
MLLIKSKGFPYSANSGPCCSFAQNVLDIPSHGLRPCPLFPYCQLGERQEFPHSDPLNGTGLSAILYMDLEAERCIVCEMLGAGTVYAMCAVCE